jgi:hypothetical protein
MTPRPYLRIALFSLLAVIVIVVLCFGFVALGKSFQRYQKRADANNRVQVSEIEIKNQEQRVLIAKQQAEIRHQEAIGIRAAQDEIAKTLTPAYLVHELTQAMRESGADLIYIPTNPETGLPIVPTTNRLQP